VVMSLLLGSPATRQGGAPIKHASAWRRSPPCQVRHRQPPPLAGPQQLLEQGRAFPDQDQHVAVVRRAPLPLVLAEHCLAPRDQPPHLGGHEGGGTPVEVSGIRRIGHEATRFHKLPPVKDRWQPLRRLPRGRRRVGAPRGLIEAPESQAFEGFALTIPATRSAYPSLLKSPFS